MEVVVTTQAHHLNEVGGGLFEPTASKACVSNMLKLHEVVVPYKPTASDTFRWWAIVAHYLKLHV